MIFRPRRWVPTRLIRPRKSKRSTSRS